jgi:hypothetical protein
MDYRNTYTKNLFPMEAPDVLGVDLEDLIVLVAVPDRSVPVIVVDLDDHVVPSEDPGDPEGHVNSAGAVRAEVLAVVHVC